MQTIRLRSKWGNLISVRDHQIKKIGEKKMSDKEKLQKIKLFCEELLNEHSLQSDSVLEEKFFDWTDFDKIIKIIDGEKK